jgi:YHS domain-containing protein
MLVLFLAGTSHSLTAQHDLFLTNEEGVAIKGFDVVSYYKGDKPKQGDASYSFDYDGVSFYFASAENRRAFARNPEKYLPEYGGYCAFAMATKGQKIDADPQTYVVEDGKLFLFFNGEMNGKQMNTKKPWMDKKGKLQVEADKNWSALTSNR